MGATPLLDLKNWHSSTRIHGPTDNQIWSMECKDTRLCNHQSRYIVIQTLYLSKETGKPFHKYVWYQKFYQAH